MSEPDEEVGEYQDRRACTRLAQADGLAQGHDGESVSADQLLVKLDDRDARLLLQQEQLLKRCRLMTCR